MSNTFCMAPWHDLHIVTDGGIKGCCVMSSGPTKGRYMTNGIPVTIEDGLDAGMNSDTAKSLRKAMLRGVWHPECKRCHDEEASGMRSMRGLYEERWGKRFTLEDAQKITDPKTGEVPKDHKPFFYDIQLGNLCNLKCRICGPQCSSTWTSDHQKLMKLGDSWEQPLGQGRPTIKIEHVSGKKYKMTPDPFAWANSDEFWNIMSERKSSIEHLYLIGGEPMMIQRHFKFLEECVESGDSKHIVLQYDTNLTNIPEKVMGYWSHFKELWLAFSIDGFGPELEYMRHPIKWDHMLRNINRVEEYAKNNKNVSLHDGVTISMYNVLHILDYIEWKVKAVKYDFEHLFQFHESHFGTHPLHAPRHLSIKTMPKSAKVLVEKKYNEWRVKMCNWLDSLDGFYTYKINPEELKACINKFVDTHIALMNQEDWSKEMHRFWSYTNDLDAIRDEDFKAVFPEEYRIFNDFQSKPQWKFLPTEAFYEE